MPKPPRIEDFNKHLQTLVVLHSVYLADKTREMGFSPYMYTTGEMSTRDVVKLNYFVLTDGKVEYTDRRINDILKIVRTDKYISLSDYSYEVYIGGTISRSIFTLTQLGNLYLESYIEDLKNHYDTFYLLGEFPEELRKRFLVENGSKWRSYKSKSPRSK